MKKLLSKHEEKGFLIIELMISLAIIIMLVTTTVPWGARIIAHYYCWYETLNKNIETCLACNLIREDITKGSRSPLTWHNDETSDLLGKKHDGTWFRWTVRQGTLVRISGPRSVVIEEPNRARAIPVLKNVSSFAAYREQSERGVSLICAIITSGSETHEIKGVPRHAYE